MKVKHEFNGSEGSFIPLTEAKAKTSRYRQQHKVPNTIKEKTPNTIKEKAPNTIKAFFFGKEKIKEILNQDGCMGIRVYYGANANDTPELVMIGADENMNDITARILDRAFPCPTYCSHNGEGLG